MDQQVHAFMTGSRIYGTPREDSDIDLVVYMTDLTIAALAVLSDPPATKDDEGSNLYPHRAALRFGRLNLLCVSDPKHFQVWAQGTAELIAKSPVTRAQAVEHLAALRLAADIRGW